MAPDIVGSTIAGVISGVFGLCCALVLLRWCRRRRFYKKVQRAMDAEELAFQKSLAKNYSEEMAELDDTERERLKLLENYMDSVGASMAGGEDGRDAAGSNLENVEAFLDQLAKTAAEAEQLEEGSAGATDASAAHGDEVQETQEITPAPAPEDGATPKARWKET
mmetsp:Transcript_19413/g.65096  ORF Transcript_19413/g.65096 Transcript_19413/m.65096 type:complete len:165 (+) Transcript_19413:1285-1779(+)